jgi:hypothetical protein
MKFFKVIYWFLISIQLLFFSLLSIISISEWWKVEISKDINNYAFGPINENPWFYETPGLYSKIELIEGLIFAGLALFIIRYIYKKDYRKMNYSILVCYIFFLF